MVKSDKNILLKITIVILILTLLISLINTLILEKTLAKGRNQLYSYKIPCSDKECNGETLGCLQVQENTLTFCLLENNTYQWENING